MDAPEARAPDEVVLAPAETLRPEPPGPASGPAAPPPVSPSAPADAVDAWRLVRGVIEHEDNLVNHRLTWLLTMQGFLFTAFALAANALVTQQQGRGTLLWWIGLGSAVVGVLSPWFVWPSLIAGLFHLRNITNWWIHHWGERTTGAGVRYPRVRGFDWSASPEDRGDRPPGREIERGWPRRAALARRLQLLMLDTFNIPILLSAVWAVLLLVVLFYAPPRRGPNKVTVTGPNNQAAVAVEFGGN